MVFYYVWGKQACCKNQVLEMHYGAMTSLRLDW